jgi:PAS domain S-box-containing protein
MPFSTILTAHPGIQRLLQIRSRPLVGFALALCMVALATLLRWVLGPETGLPFITYFPAVTVTALAAGLWPAILAALLSGILALLLFAGDYSWSVGDPRILSWLFFLLMAAIIIAVVALLHKAVDQLIEQERNIRNLIETAPTGIVVVEQGGRIQLVNASAERLFGYSREELIGHSVDSLVPERHTADHAKYRKAFFAKPETRPMGQGKDLSGRHKNGSEFHAEVGLSPFTRDTHRYVLATVIDVSERRRAQDREKLLARELQHRTQNLFAVIQSIAARTLVKGRTVEEARSDFEGRLRALANANQALSSGVSEGALLLEIVRKEMDGFASTVDIKGCDVTLNAQAAQQFALIVHELATNATKHGALSAPSGRIAISGHIDPAKGNFVFSWTERGGPPVAPPARRGFGSVVLEEAAKPFSESVVLAFEREGIHYELRATLATILPETAPDGRRPSAAAEAPAPL